MRKPSSISLSILVLSLFWSAGLAQERPPHAVVPLKAMLARLGGVERVWGDPDKPGAPFVIRIHNDAGYVVLPHTHPEDEHIVVVKGSWSLAMGARFDRSALEPLEVGDYGFVPKKMAHYGWAKTELTIQVHGIGPFSTDFVDPVFELSGAGVSVVTIAGQPGPPTSSVPPNCFLLKIGDRVGAARGEGMIIGGLCSVVSQFTQYRIEKSDGERFWATAEELRKL